jgi:hypothetical protein
MSTEILTIRLKLLTRRLALFALLLGVGVLSLSTAQAETPPTPTGSDDYLSTVRKQIVLRTVDGDPVAGVTVQLTPAEPRLGGIGERAQPKRAVTDPHGTATFTGLSRWVWMASFGGAFRGRAIQPLQEQGRAPYGRTRAGGGFPVVVQLQEEDAAATPVVVQGISQPEIQPSMFVLVPVQERWVPALDLSLPGEHPQPLAMLSGTESTRASAPAPTSSSELIGSADALNTRANSFERLAQWFYILPLAVALYVLYRAWQERWQGKQKSRFFHLDGQDKEGSA